MANLKNISVKKADSFNRARVEILNYIICFSTYKTYGSGQFSIPREESSFTGGSFSDKEPPVGALCKLSSAPFSKWYLSWLVSIFPKPDGFSTVYLLQSIEDGSLCNWSNVSVEWYNVETVAKFPQWRWSDAQFEFDDKWKRAAQRKSNYMVVPLSVDFNGDEVTLSTRRKFTEGANHQKTFPNWRKVLSRDMVAFYEEAVGMPAPPQSVNTP